jgi:hypothetical protein
MPTPNHHRWPSSGLAGLRPRVCRQRTLLSLAAGLAAVVWLWPGSADAQIKRPGAHPKYDVEIEPHLFLQWAQEPVWDEGVGFGLRASIPVIDNGPIPKLNNTFAISFGMDVAFFDDCGRRYWRDYDYWGDNCDAQDWQFPVAGQWNFFFTDIVSVAAEVGLSISHERVSWEYECGGGRICEADDSDTDLEVVAWGGGRFMFGDTVGLFARIGTPYISIGATFLI